MNSYNDNKDSGILSVSERKLLLAVLQKAVYDFLFAEGEIKESARDWIFDDDYDANLKFRFVCDCLGLEPSAVRERIRKLSAESDPSELEDALV